jgi:FkbM family methyltransferase
MKLHFKKAVRSLQVLTPGLQDVRFALHQKFLHVAGRAWRPDVEAVRYLNVDDPEIIDVGANRGFSISSFLMLRPRARIIAFEPLTRFAESLRARYESNHNVTVRACALGAVNAKMTIYIPVYRGYVFDPLASLDYDEAANWVNSDRFYFFDNTRLQVQTDEVNVHRLDDFATEPDVIKIYAQGYEPEVIKGGEITIHEHEPAIMVPARIPRIDRCLRDLGYTRFAFYKSKLYRDGEGHTSSWYLKRKHFSMFRCQFI